MLSRGFRHGYVASKLGPDVADVVVRALVESKSDTADVDGSLLAGTQVERLRDDRLVRRNIRWLVLALNNDICEGGHGGGY